MVKQRYNSSVKQGNDELFYLLRKHSPYGIEIRHTENIAYRIS